MRHGTADPVTRTASHGTADPVTRTASHDKQVR